MQQFFSTEMIFFSDSFIIFILFIFITLLLMLSEKLKSVFCVVKKRVNQWQHINPSHVISIYAENICQE